MLHANTIVHGMWVGEELSKLELLTISSFLACGHQFWLWTYTDIKTHLPKGIHLKDARAILPETSVFRYKHGNQFGHGKGSLAGFSDIFRYKLLYEYGGWWTDMDITCLRPLDFEEAYVFRSHDVFPVVGNLMKCPKKSTLMLECFEQATEAVTEENTDWLLPIKILNDQIEQQHLSKYIREISNPDRWEIVHFYATFPAKLRPELYVLHWMNEEWRARGLDKNTCIRYSLMDQLMSRYAIEIERHFPPHKIAYIRQWLKMKGIPLIPHPLRRVTKKLYFTTKNILLTIFRVCVLSFIPRHWKDKLKLWIFKQSPPSPSIAKTQTENV